MLGYIKKIMCTLRSLWGTPTRESGLSRGQKMAKNANFDLTRKNLVKNLKFGVISPPLIFFARKIVFQDNSIHKKRIFRRLGLSMALHMQKHGPN